MKNIINKLSNKLKCLHPESFLVGVIAALTFFVITFLLFCHNIVSVEYVRPCKCGGTLECYVSYVDGYIYEGCDTCEVVNINE